MNAQVTAAIVAGLVALLTALGTAVVTINLSRERLRREFGLEFAAERVALKLLQHPKWTVRSFEIIKAHIGGFNDDELRRILVRAGAIRFESKSGYELWALVEQTPPEWLEKGWAKLPMDLEHLHRPHEQKMKVEP